MSEASSTLSALVSATAPLLAYSIPLLIISIPLTFAGTFLTLDRSRSFPSSYTPVTLPGALDSPKKLSQLNFPLQGGVGGLFSGYVFGIHSSTFLSLLIPATSSSAFLSSNSFLAVWILSCIPTTILGGRYRYCARIFAAITGGSSLSLAISVIIHPPLLPRQILTGLFAGIPTLLVLIFSLPHLARNLRPILRVLTASSGAFSLVLSVALLAHVPAWADIWERLWLSDGDTWGTSKEKGLSTFCVILFIAGISADFGLKHWLGECPDERWDNFLANYSANFPNDSNRAGTFHPLPSFWGRLLKSSSEGDKKDDLLPLNFPNDARNSIDKEPPDLFSDDDYDKDFAKAPIFHDHTTDNLPTTPAFLKKARSSPNAKFKRRKTGRGFQDITSVRKQPIKFGQDLSSDSSDEDLDRPRPRNVRPWLERKASMSSSSPTLVDQPTTTPFRDLTDYSVHKLKQTQTRLESGPSIGQGYTDYEEDIGIQRTKLGITSEDTVWRPEFMKRYSSSASVSSRNGAVASSTSSRDTAPIGAVPATPSLIKALDRISAAQREAFAESTLTSSRSLKDPERKGSATRAEGLPKVPETDIEDVDDYSDVDVNRKGQLAPRWEEFWDEVKHKAMT